MDSPEQQLMKLRARIDAMDVQLADIFNARIGIIAQVAALKAKHWPGACHIRPAREGQMHALMAKRFENGPFPALAALAIWRQLIGASTHLESPLNVTTLAAHPAHLWLAREYFGLQVGLREATTLDDALATITAGKSNIMILPDIRTSDWWQSATTIRAAGLFIFAALPVVSNNLPQGVTAALALAAVTPEDSGNDISYHISGGQLCVRDGFHPGEAEGMFLGAHPRAISLGE